MTAPSEQKWRFSTRAIHVGQEPDPVTGATVPPIHHSARVFTVLPDSIETETLTLFEQFYDSGEQAGFAARPRGSEIAFVFVMRADAGPARKKDRSPRLLRENPRKVRVQ